MRPSLRQIEAFLAVAEHGSFSRAAERIGSTQPALSQAVRDLEAALALRLFDRTTRRVDLTEAGRLLQERVAKGLEELDNAFLHARDLARLRRGHLRVAAPPLLAATVLPQALAGFLAAHAELTCALADVGTEEIVARVRSGQADLGIGTFQPGEPDLELRPILRDEMMLFCGCDEAPARTWRDLEHRPVITLTRASSLRLVTELGFETAGLALRPTHEVNQIATALALVEAGFGVAVLPGYARAAMRGMAVRAAPLREPSISREIMLLQARDRPPGPAAAAFAEYLARTLPRLSPAAD
ncbi:LysR family transcriptional regulator [Polymorphum gilvum]|uniref:Transcriptional regulator, LysR family n=1 Tax=Polymorphum gilvum (strain LMG 25793 / CGMCC 1.9160 / SL003B-26A1) TaxID=991905 RepID=F2IW06_POLGS|nr:LysR family transcriptional regulator [Polymorphum gilvum]ADZ70288.1 Transcriptional regulator, LysR family [Polymorphum gilvum SL003B-26A1]